MADHLNGGGNGDPAAGANPSGTGFQGAVTLTLEQIRAEIGLLNDQITEKYPDATPDELTAYQQQAYAEFIEMAQTDGGVNVTPTLFAQALDQAYDQAFQDLYFTGIGDKTPLGLGYSQTVTAGTDAWNTWLEDNPSAGVSQSVFGTGTAAKSWVPQMVTRGGTRDAAGNLILGGVQSPTDYDLMTAGQMAPYLPTAPYDLTKITQNTPAYTTTSAGLSPTLFDAINFPQNVITRGTPVITRGFDAAGQPNTAITMGQSAATPTGADIGNLTTTAQFPSTGMGIGPTGLGTTTVGTMGTTGNIVSTGADKIIQWVDENGVLQTSSVNPNVLNTGSGTDAGVTVTPGEVDLSKVQGSVAFCKINPTSPYCIEGTSEFCGLAGNLNHASCQPAKTCPSGEELWNGICLAICGANETRDSTGRCQSNDLGNCPVGTDQPGVRIPDGETVAWCTFPKCPTGTAREGVTIPVGAAADWCDIAATGTTCPAGTARANQTIPDNETIASWCDTATGDTCPAGTARANQTIPANETIASWCDAATGDTCPAGSELENEPVPANLDCNPAATALAAQKVICETAGGTWDDATGCTAAALTYCPSGSHKGTSVAIPAGQSTGWCCNTGYEWNGTACVLSGTSLSCNPGQVKRLDADGNEYCEDKAQCGIYQTYDELNNACITKSAQEVIGDLYLAEEAAIGPNATAEERHAARDRVAGQIAVYSTATDQVFTSEDIADWLNPFIGTGGTGYSADTGLSSGIVVEVDDPNTLIDESKVSQYEASKYLAANPIAGVTASMGPDEIAAWDAYFAGTGPMPATTDVQATAGGIDWTGTVADTGIATGATTAATGATTAATGATTAATGATGAVTTLVDPYASQKVQCELDGKVWNEVSNICGGVAGTAVTGATVTGTAVTGAGGTTIDPLASFGSVVGSVTPAELTSLVNMINTGQTTVGAIAGHYNVPEGTIQSYLNSLTTPGATTPGATTTLVDPYLTQKATCETNGGTWNDTSNSCIPATVDLSGIDLTAITNQANTSLGGILAPDFGMPIMGFQSGGLVEDRHRQRQDAVGSRLMRHAGLGQFADQIGEEMLSTIARIMDRRD